MSDQKRFRLLSGGLKSEPSQYRTAEGETDWEAVRAGFLRGEPEAFHAVSSLVVGTLQHHGLPAFEVEDLVMEVLAGLHRARETPSSGSYRGYLMTAARNKFRDWCRRNSRAALETIDQHSDELEAPSALDEFAMASLLTALKQLGSRHRSAVYGRFFLNKSVAELATELGLAESSVRRLIGEAKLELRRLLLGS